MGDRQGAVEAMVIDPAFWRGRRVLLTGHTGLKGGWSALALAQLGADVTGFALAPEHPHGLFEAAGVAALLDHRLGDLRDADAVAKIVAQARPEIVIHMGAQALVRRGYDDPLGTWATNAMGTAHLLQALRSAPHLRAAVVVTSDKCYEPGAGESGHVETDPLGGRDPYSASKAAAEIITDSFRRSWFSAPDAAQIATVRAGNVIGGGDWAADRIVPDALRAFSAGETLAVRSPNAVRPWQHALDPVLAYLALAERLATSHGFAEAWNFGPGRAGEINVAQLADELAMRWGDGAAWRIDARAHPAETEILRLDCAKAQTRLGWRPLLPLTAALDMTMDWARAQKSGSDMKAFSHTQTAAALRAAMTRETDEGRT